MRGRDRSRYQGRVEPATFLDRMASYGARDAWDFTTNTYMRSGVIAPSGITFTRASVGSYLNTNNTMTVFSSGQPRIGDKGILIEGSRQNLFLNSAVGATQSITVTAAAHTLSFYGTGTITLSGVSTAGPLVGTGEFNRVSLTFTPTAGSLTLTVSGDIKWVNLELGSFPSSWIPSDGTAVTRAADVATAGYTTNYPVTILAEFIRDIDTNGNEQLLQLDNGGSSNRIRTFVANNDIFNAVMISGGVNTAVQTVAGAVSVGATTKIAVRAQVDNFIAAKNGTLSSLVSSCAVPAFAPTILRFGADTGSVFTNSYFQKVALFPIGLLDTQLQAVTT